MDLVVMALAVGLLTVLTVISIWAFALAIRAMLSILRRGPADFIGPDAVVGGFPKDPVVLH